MASIIHGHTGKPAPQVG